MLKHLLVAVVASAFSLGAHAQATKAEPKGQTGTTTQPASPSAKSEVKAEEAKKAKGKTKVAKAKTTKAKPDTKAEPKKETK